MTDDFRRVVTAVDGDGHSVVDSDGLPPVVISPRHPDQFLTAIWTVDELPTSYTAPGDRDGFRLSPPTGGVNIIRNKLPPDSVMYVDADGNPRPVADGENLHRAATVDFICVLEGELWLVLEGDDDVHLQAGDWPWPFGGRWTCIWRTNPSGPTSCASSPRTGSGATTPTPSISSHRCGATSPIECRDDGDGRSICRSPCTVMPVDRVAETR